MTEPLTVGQMRVRMSFNPSSNPVVDDIKRKTAELIDLCLTGTDGQRSETSRCAALAATHYETAAMYAVKAATTGT